MLIPSWSLAARVMPSRRSSAQRQSSVGAQPASGGAHPAQVAGPRMQQPRQQQPHRPLAAWQQPSSTSSSWSAPQRDRHDFGMWGHGAFGPGQPSGDWNVSAQEFVPSGGYVQAGDWNVSAQEFVPSGGFVQADRSATSRPGEGNQEGPPGCVNQMGPQGKGMVKMSYPRGPCLQFAGLVPAPWGVPCGWIRFSVNLLQPTDS